MSSHGYASGRLNLPFVGLCSFGKYPYQGDWDAIDADIAFLGAPFDFGTQYRPGAIWPPRHPRSVNFISFGHAGAYDHEDDITYLTEDQGRIVDIGDADVIIPTPNKAMPILKKRVRAILNAGAIPIVLGVIIRSIFLASMRLAIKSHFIWCRLMPIWILLMCVMM